MRASIGTLGAWMAGAWFTIFPPTDWAFHLLAMTNAALGLKQPFDPLTDFTASPARVEACDCGEGASVVVAGITASSLVESEAAVRAMIDYRESLRPGLALRARRKLGALARRVGLRAPLPSAS